MTYTDWCRLCKKEWTFHDDDRDEPRLCDDCQGVWQNTKIIGEIMEGTYMPITETTGDLPYRTNDETEDIFADDDQETEDVFDDDDQENEEDEELA